jgi:hypothetical protein
MWVSRRPVPGCLQRLMTWRFTVTAAAARTSSSNDVLSIRPAVPSLTRVKIAKAAVGHTERVSLVRRSGSGPWSPARVRRVIAVLCLPERLHRCISVTVLHG